MYGSFRLWIQRSFVIVLSKACFRRTLQTLNFTRRKKNKHLPYKVGRMMEYKYTNAHRKLSVKLLFPRTKQTQRTNIYTIT